MKQNNFNCTVYILLFDRFTAYSKFNMKGEIFHLNNIKLN